MIGCGTLANAGAILLGGFVGLLVGKRLGVRYRETMRLALATAVMFVGIGGTLREMLRVGADGRLSLTGSLMLVVSLVLGAIVGELLDLDTAFERFAVWLKRVSHNENDASFVHAFVTASLTFCIGAMAIVGAVEDGVRSDPSLLYLKAVMDGVFTVIMTSAYGRGAVFSAVPVFVYQGLITLLAVFAAPYVTPEAMSRVSLVGNLLIFSVGWNLVHGEKKVRVANLLPSLVFAAFWPWPV